MIHTQSDNIIYECIRNAREAEKEKEKEEEQVLNSQGGPNSCAGIINAFKGPHGTTLWLAQGLRKGRAHLIFIVFSYLRAGLRRAPLPDSMH